ncbi:MAG: hypothetical protein SFW63_06410 [Alphaproteobacteria bacterium]|nr:hypothetical protein [Alphaproteobacteria bacterium]
MGIADTFKSWMGRGAAGGSSVANTVNSVGGAVVDGAAAATGAGIGAAAGGAAAVGGGIAGFLRGMVTRPGAALKGAVGIGIAAAAAGGIYLAIRGGKKQQSSSEAMTAAALNDLPPPLAMDVPQTMMGMQPQPGEHAARVQASRAGGQQLGM